MMTHFYCELFPIILTKTICLYSHEQELDHQIHRGCFLSSLQVVSTSILRSKCLSALYIHSSQYISLVSSHRSTISKILLNSSFDIVLFALLSVISVISVILTFSFRLHIANLE